MYYLELVTDMGWSDSNQNTVFLCQILNICALNA